MEPDKKYLFLFDLLKIPRMISPKKHKKNAGNIYLKNKRLLPLNAQKKLRHRKQKLHIIFKYRKYLRYLLFIKVYNNIPKGMLYIIKITASTYPSPIAKCWLPSQHFPYF